MANLIQSQQPPQTRPPHTNTWATLSLICGVLSFSLFSAPIAILAGLIALYQIQIERTGDEGKGQAIAGILLGIFVPLVLMIAFVIAYGIGESLA